MKHYEYKERDYARRRVEALNRAGALDGRMATQVDAVGEARAHWRTMHAERRAQAWRTLHALASMRTMTDPARRAMQALINCEQCIDAGAAPEPFYVSVLREYIAGFNNAHRSAVQDYINKLEA